jgi:hypothetical protein
MLFERLQQKKGAQLLLGLLFGFAFGFLLQKGGVTEYDILIGQLLLTDFTVVKIIVTAIVVGMAGVHLLASFNLVQLHVKRGSWGASLIGGLLFGVGFGLLGYCPGTVSGAAAKGYMDALLGGIPGLLVGAGLFAALFPTLRDHILNRGDFGELTFDQALKLNKWAVVCIFEAVLIIALWFIDRVAP